MELRGALVFTLPPTGDVELDCGGLSYCSGPLSTGRDITQMKMFPRDFDSDGDGFGTMVETKPPFNPQRDGFGTTDRIPADARVFVLKPGAPASLIGSGDTYIERSGTSQQPVMLNYVFGTVPAMAGWSDGDRNVTVSYPVPNGDEGTESNPYRARGYNGSITFTIWRPQRRSIPGAGESADWIDIGHLIYTVAGFMPSFGDKVWRCPPSAYSSTDPNITLEPTGMRDNASDAPADPGHTLTFTVDIAACLNASGIGTPSNFSSSIFFTAASDFGDAAEGGGFSFAAPQQQP